MSIGAGVCNSNTLATNPSNTNPFDMGTLLRVATLNNLLMSGDDGSGFMMDVFFEIIARLSLRGEHSVRTHLYTPTHSPVYGAPMENGSWSGIIGEVVDGRADIAVADISITAERSKHVAFTRHVFEDSLGVLSLNNADGNVESWNLLSNEITRPFSWGVWLLWLLLGVFTLSVFSRLVDQPKAFLGTYVYSYFGGLKAPGNVVSIGPLAVFFSFSLFSHFLWIVYGARYIASTVLSFQEVHTDLKSVSRSSKPFAVLGDSSIESFFLGEPSTLVNRMSRRMNTVETTEDGVRGVRNGTFSAFISDGVTIRNHALQPPCVLVASSVDEGEAGIAFVLRPDFAARSIPGHNMTWKRWFDNEILRMRRTGEMKKMMDRHTTDAYICDEEKHDRIFEGARPLELKEIGPFMVLYGIVFTIGCSVAAYQAKFQRMSRNASSSNDLSHSGDGNTSSSDGERDSLVRPRKRTCTGGGRKFHIQAPRSEQRKLAIRRKLLKDEMSRRRWAPIADTTHV